MRPTIDSNTITSTTTFQNAQQAVNDRQKARGESIKNLEQQKKDTLQEIRLQRITIQKESEAKLTYYSVETQQQKELIALEERKFEFQKEIQQRMVAAREKYNSILEDFCKILQPNQNSGK